MAATVSLLAGSACERAPGGPCASTADCLQSEICVDGWCRAVCNSTGDCAAGERCSEGICLPAAATASDASAPDRAAVDGSSPPLDAATDAARSDRSTHDAAAGDTAAADTSTPDASAPDAATADRAAPDAIALDAAAADGVRPEAATLDTVAPDARTSDAVAADAAAADSMPAPEAGAADGAAADTGGGEAGGGDVDQAVCGNRSIDPGERCDDGNLLSFDGCSDDCDYVIWQRDLGAEIDGAALVSWTVGSDIPERLLGVGTRAGVLHALRASDGTTVWTYDAGAPIAATAMADAVAASHIYLLSTDGVVHGLDPLGPDPDGSPLWLAALDSGSSAMGLALGNNGVIAVDDTGTLYNLTPDGERRSFFGSYGYRTYDLGSCDRCALTSVSRSNPGRGVAVALDNMLWVLNFYSGCAPLSLALEPEERVLGDIPFKENDTSSSAFVVTSLGRLRELEYTITSGSCQLAWLSRGWWRDTGTEGLRTPALVLGGAAPADGALFYGGADGNLHRLDVAQHEQGPRWSCALGAPLAAMVAVGNTAVFAGSDDGVLHKVGLQDGTLLWSEPLAAAISGSPLLADGAIYASAVDGRVYALERGDDPASSEGDSWRRQSGGAQGQYVGSTCRAMGGKPSLLLSLLLGLAWCGRRRIAWRRLVRLAWRSLACGAAIGLAVLPSGCPVEVHAPAQLRFACQTDADCARGFRCDGRACVLVAPDAGTVVRDGSPGDGPARDHPALDAIAQRDRPAPEPGAQDAAELDAAPQDGAPADHTPGDSPGDDRAAGDRPHDDRAASDLCRDDRSASDRSLADRAQGDRLVADRAAPDRGASDLGSDADAADAGCQAGWWDCAWARRRQIVFRNAALGEPLVQFPLLVVLDSSRVDYGATLAGGDDLRFVDASGADELAHEIERWDQGGRSYVWVRVPQIDATDADFIWMYYGNAGAAPPDPGRAVQVWSDGFQAVYHLAGDLRDASGNGLHGDDQSHPTSDGSGQIGRGRVFAGDQSYVDLGSDLPLARGVSSCTLSAWAREDDNGYEQHLISISRNNSGSPTTDSRATLIFKMNEFRGGGRSADDEGFIGGDTVGAGLVAGQWYYLAAVIDFAADEVRFYKNDDYAFTLPVGFAQGQTPDTPSTSNALGSEDPGGSGFFAGTLDEVRVVARGRSAAWLAAEYRSQADLGFVQHGDEELR